MSTQAVEQSPNPPTITLDIGKKDVTQIRSLKPGDAVDIRLRCVVTEVSEKEPDTGYPVGYAGRLVVEYARPKITKNNAFSDLSDDDSGD